MPTVDRIAFLQRRAALEQSLFAEDKAGIVLEIEYWTARNGWRHLLRLVKLVDGQRVEEFRSHPELDESRRAKCLEKRLYRNAHLEEIRRRDRLRKRRLRSRRRRVRLVCA
jgi:hypothetical protein